MAEGCAQCCARRGGGSGGRGTRAHFESTDDLKHKIQRTAPENLCRGTIPSVEWKRWWFSYRTTNFQIFGNRGNRWSDRKEILERRGEGWDTGKWIFREALDPEDCVRKFLSGDHTECGMEEVVV